MADPQAPARTAHEAGAAAREAAVERALAGLGLDAKTRLLAGQDMWTLPALPEIGLASLVMSDGPIGVRGVRWTADDPSVALPSPTALAASWDPDLARRAGVLLAQEARRKGVHVLLAPTVNLHRSPLGGRHFEAYSEDPYLTGRIGTGYVAGVQSGGVATTVKHFVANDAESDRFTVNNLVSERALHELYLAPFEAIVAGARPWGVMTAYNSVNGPTMTEHRHLVQEVLRGAWGFDGFNVSDWMAARSTTGALRGGLDVAMPGPRTVYGEALARAVRAGEVTEAEVDAAVRNVLRLAARVGVLDGAEPAVTEPPATVDGPALAREIARRSFVLVRNERAALPLRSGTVALIGAAARDARILGGGSATVFPARVVSPLDGLTAALPEGSITYAVGADPNTVVVVNSGSPVELPWREEVAAVLLSWFPGQEGGAALADVLTGRDEPGGRLPTTWGALADAPVTRVTPENGELPYDEDLFIGYRAWDRAGRTPAYPFGHGLGYTDWTYESVEVDGTTAKVRLRNTGDRSGREVVQLYLAPAEPDASRPVRWLAGFAGAEAGPGERAEVTVELPRRAFEVWDEATGSWAFVKGSYELRIGRSIADRRITATITV
ncbi:beta-glucosidase [Streptomyces rochei]|uniref:beta-glucosidase n=1 Tax=Streptomyces rochei TaxID=1928 RepID=UPI00367DD575